MTDSLWLPPGIDPDAEIAAAMTLAELDTPDGPARFMVGAEGRFVSTDGRVWWGSSLIRVEDIENGIGGTAPGGRATVAYLQDPFAPQLSEEVRRYGVDWLAGRPIRLFLQTLRWDEEFAAPVLPPVLHQTRTMRGLDVSLDGPLRRVLTLEFEGPAEGRRQRRGLFYTTEDHAALIGAANPSLSLMPTSDVAEEPLF